MTNSKGEIAGFLIGFLLAMIIFYFIPFNNTLLLTDKESKRSYDKGYDDGIYSASETIPVSYEWLYNHMESGELFISPIIKP